MIAFIKDQGVDTLSGFVPLGYDYSCDSQEGCVGEYSSFNTEKSKGLGFEFKSLVKSSNFEADGDDDKKYFN